MDKLKKKTTLEFVIICMCISMFIIYMMGLIIPNIYFSDFLLSTILVILVGVIFMVILPLYFRDLRIADEKKEVEINAKTTTKLFWSHCVVVSGLISIASMISFFILYVLVLLLNLTSRVLNRIATVLMIIIIIFTIVFFVIIFIRDAY